MGALVLVDGDLLSFSPAFGPREVTVTGTAAIRASGRATIGGRRICLSGDEQRVQVQASYLLPGYTPGSGLITIVSLNLNQITTRIGADRRPFIVEGTEFIAQFSPIVPAVMSSAPFAPDSSKPDMGQGRFQAQQRFVMAG